MICLRLVVAGDLTDRVLDTLAADPAVAHVALERGASLRPAGDVIVADVAREAASALIDRLEALGLADSGAIFATESAVALSRAADAAEAAAPGDPSEAVVWQEVAAKTGEETRLSVTFLLFLVIAMVIASLGVLLDQPILIVGAMVVGPEFGPLAALCLALVERDRRGVGGSLLALGVGFTVGGVVTVLTTFLLTALGLVGRGMLLAERPLTDFIWRPDALSWIVALLAGVAGILSLTTAKSGALVGVLISVTTVPAAANAAVAFAYGVPAEATGSLVQLGLNLSAIIVAGVSTIGAQRLLARSAQRASDRTTAR
ncbi:MAG: DUF389 domain-containing protein [Micrococcales bacterium]|nr:DUF389 domain-containing protein [Micrococcales bacterium]